MSNIVALSTTEICFLNEDTTSDTALVTTAAYQDGQIMQQYGEGSDWVEIKPPGLGVKKVGVCRACGFTIYEDDQWLFSSKDGGWTEHELQEDCRE